MSDSTSAAAARPVARLADDRRLAILSGTALGGGCAIVFVPVTFIGLAFLFRDNKPVSNGLLTAAGVSLGIFFVVWVVAFFGFRLLFFRRAVNVEQGLPRSAIPRIVLSSSTTGAAEWSTRVATRGSMGRLGRCWVELYADGIQITKAPDRPEPRWQFAYRDLLQVESVDLITTTRNGDVHQYLVRLIVDRPRMVFLFGSHWTRNPDVPVLAQKLREHGV